MTLIGDRLPDEVGNRAAALAENGTLSGYHAWLIAVVEYQEQVALDKAHAPAPPVVDRARQQQDVSAIMGRLINSQHEASERLGRLHDENKAEGRLVPKQRSRGQTRAPRDKKRSRDEQPLF